MSVGNTSINICNSCINILNICNSLFVRVNRVACICIGLCRCV